MRTVAVGRIVVRVAGDLSGEDATAVRRTLAGELVGSPAVLVVDLRTVTRIDVNGIDTLLTVAELAAGEDILLCLVMSPAGPVAAALEAAGSSETFEIFSTISDALRSAKRF